MSNVALSDPGERCRIGATGDENGVLPIVLLIERS
jgi:hypothetical protein